MYLREPFSASPYYDYADSFMLGFKPDDRYDYTQECFDNLVYIIDEWIYFRNNITIRESYFDPFLNFTAFIGGNLSEAVVNCYKMGVSIVEVSETEIEAYD